VFIFSDNDIINEAFVEDINNILSVGEIPNLFSPKEDLPAIREKIKKEYIREFGTEGKELRVSEDELNEYFFTRMQSNFHLMICMSKTGDNLRNYCRMYPGLVNNTTLIWFMPWPQEALIEVAQKYLKEIDISANLVVKDDDKKPPLTQE
jgi:dynein heavy chain